MEQNLNSSFTSLDGEVSSGSRLDRTFSFLIRRPYVLVLLMILGGVIGFFSARLVPATYLATATQSITVDFTRTGTLSDLDVDRMLGVAEDWVLSPAVLNETARRTQLDVASFRAMATLRRTNDRLTLTVRGENASETTVRAYVWLDVAADALREAQATALIAEEKMTALRGLTACVQEAAAEPLSRRCTLQGEALDAEIARLGAEISELNERSGGLSPALRFGVTNLDGIEVRRVNAGSGALTLVGAILGLIVTIVLGAIIGMPVRRSDEACA